MEDNNYVFNGELFIRRGPSIVDITDELKKTNDKIYDLEFETTTKEGINNSLYDKLEESKMYRDFLLETDGDDDYSKVDCFYQVYATENGFELHDLPYREDIRKYRSAEEINKDFISLREFMSKGKYIGRYFYRTEPCVYNGDDYDGSFTKNNIIPLEDLVLYSYEDIFIVRESTPLTNKTMILIVDSRYIKDGKYEFYGDYVEEEPKKVLYNEIIEQCKNKINREKSY